MDCTKCLNKGCRTLSPCKDESHAYLVQYKNEENTSNIRCASALIDNGRAGKLSRLEEIIEYLKIKDYKSIGVAYCYSIENEAVELRKILENEGFTANMISCTVDGLSESVVNSNKDSNVVSCNPLGQSHILNKSGADFTILMGLCLGHDIILQNNLKMDFTTFVVKDRVLNNNPILALNNEKDSSDTFIEQMPKDFLLIKADDLRQILHRNDLYLLDLRDKEQYIKDHLEYAVNCELNDLPNKYKELLTNKNNQIIVYCNGGIQSIYAVMYLNLKGYENVKSLAGGYSKFKVGCVKN